MLAQRDVWMMRDLDYPPLCHRIREWVFDNYLSESSDGRGRGRPWICDPSMPPYTMVELPINETSLQLTLYEPRSDQPFAPYLELKGLFKDLRFEGFDTDYWRAWRYQKWCTPWKRHWYHDYDRGLPDFREESPDLDKAERDEMDADSWGVPDIEETESDSDSEYDSEAESET